MRNQKKYIDELTQNDFYYCYDTKLSNHFKRKGIRYFLKARSVKDSSIFTMYLITDELRKAIEEHKQLHNE